MNRHLLAVRIASVALTLAFAAPSEAAAPQHHHYKLIDIGTFGGPESFVNEPNAFINAAGDLDRMGSVVGSATTTVPLTATSNPLGCSGLGSTVGFVMHPFAWRDGRLSDLGALPGPANCAAASAINSRGEIVGGSENGEIDPLTGFNQSRAVRWKNGRIETLGSLGGNQGTAAAINARGQIVGIATNDTPDPIGCFGLGTQCRAFLWQNGEMQDLGTLGGPDALGFLINERGQVAGAAYTSFASMTTDPFLWENGTMTDLGSFGGTFGVPLALNNQGQVVGSSNLVGDNTSHPFLWDHGTLIDLGTLGGIFGTANAINEGRDVAGNATNAGDQAVHAALWRNGAITDVGTLPSDSCSSANAVNAKRQVVGISADCNFVSRRAFLWEGGSIVDLNTLVGSDSHLQLTIAEAINDRGEIAGNGTPPGCAVLENCGHAFLLIPCDENHPGIEGCDYSPVEVSMVAASHATETQKQLTPQEISRIRDLLMKRNRGLMPRTIH
jgi:probable HAF family extracellular repeat protein